MAVFSWQLKSQILSSEFGGDLKESKGDGEYLIFFGIWHQSRLLSLADNITLCVL